MPQTGSRGAERGRERIVRERRAFPWAFMRESGGGKQQMPSRGRREEARAGDEAAEQQKKVSQEGTMDVRRREKGQQAQGGGNGTRTEQCNTVEHHDGQGRKGRYGQGQQRQSTKGSRNGSARGQVADCRKPARHGRSKEGGPPTARNVTSGTEGGPKHRAGASWTKQNGKNVGPWTATSSGRGPAPRDWNISGRQRRQAGGPRGRSSRGRKAHSPGPDHLQRREKKELTA